MNLDSVRMIKLLVETLKSRNSGTFLMQTGRACDAQGSKDVIFLIYGARGE